MSAMPIVALVTLVMVAFAYMYLDFDVFFLYTFGLLLVIVLTGAVYITLLLLALRDTYLPWESTQGSPIFEYLHRLENGW